MRYFSIYIPDPKTNAETLTGKRKEDMDAFVAGAIQRGELLTGGAFQSIREHGCVVRRTSGRSAVIDGPYTESKELLGGFAILEFPSREAAVDGALRFLEVAGDGECVTYQIDDGPAH